MKAIEGTATIGLKTLDNLRLREQWFSELRRDVKKLIKAVDSEEYEKRCKQIDDMGGMSDEEFDRLEKEAATALKIIISDKALRKLVHEYIDESESDVNYALHTMEDNEFLRIPLILESGQHQGQTGGQQDISVCEVCEAYMTDVECDMKEDCPAVGIVKRLKEAEETIKKRDKEIKRLTKKLSDSELEKSYMRNPMAIGDRHEMGG